MSKETEKSSSFSPFRSTHGTADRDQNEALQDPVGKSLDGQCPPLSLMIVEDSAIVRERLISLVSELTHIATIGEAADGFEARKLFQSLRPDVVILDIGLPGIDGIDLLKEFKTAVPSCVIVMLTGHSETEFRRRCLDLGADHFFVKSSESERILDVLNTNCLYPKVPKGA